MDNKSEPGRQALNEVVSKLKAEERQKQEAQESAIEEVKTQLATLHENKVLSQMYADNAKVGADNLGGELPILKVYAAGKSGDVELADGSNPHDGYFFYKPTGEEMETVTCHILTISKGFRAEGMEKDKDTGKPVLKYNQIIGGLIVSGNDYRPFVTFFTGMKLSKLWEFGKAAGKYTRARPVSIPMFALTVELSTVKEQTAFGKNWVINFEILKDESGYPKLVLDEGEFQFLKDSVETMEDTIASVIDARSVKEFSDEKSIESLNQPDAVTGEVVEEMPQTEQPDIPF